MFSNIYQSLKSGFNQSWFKFLFIKTALAKLLAKDQEPSPWDFFTTYLSSWWWNRLWFRFRIQNTANFYQFNHIIWSLQALEKAGILTETNCNLVATHANPDDLASALFGLQQAGILTQDNFTLVAAHAHPDGLDCALSCLQQARILTQDNFALVAAHTYSYNLASALSYLQQAGILTQDNFALVAAHAKPRYLASALFGLLQAGILTQDHRVLLAAHAHPNDLASALFRLQQAGILTQDNRALLAAHAHPDVLASALSCLQQSGILTQDNFTLVAIHAKPYYLASALSCLQEAGILTQDNFETLLAHANPDDLASALFHLQKAGILTQDNRALVVAHAHPNDLASALSCLQRAGILTQDNFALVAAHAKPDRLVFALFRLQQAGILTQDNRALVAAHAHPNGLASALSRLQQAGILTQDNFAPVVAHAHPNDLASALFRLQQAGILTQDNRALLAAHAHLFDLDSALSYLLGAEILTQDNFETLLAPNHVSLVSDTSYRLIWSRIPNHLLTQVNFQRLLTAAEHVNPMIELPRVVNQILGIQAVAGVGHAVAFNDRQSTHTASVHASVSASAVKLMQTYGDDLNLELKIKEIKAYVNGLTDSSVTQAAKSCIKRITAADYTFTDTSGVSIRQLLALAYTAIHDASKCSATLDDAKTLFIESLYEIQRGYNLNAAGDDQGGNDFPICTAGTFNKLMEKLNGIHADVEVYYITHEGALWKFQRLAIAHATTYLQSLATPVTVEGYLRIKDLLEHLKTNGSLEPMWEPIKAEVQAELWDEFKEAYGHNSSNVQFLNLIDYGHQVNMPNLSAIETTLLASPGYQAYLKEQMCLSLGEQRLLLSLEKHGFWANRHSNPKAQENFDKRYGLVLKL